jgi:drug/metabolite transporter (DMT)-like permease
MATLEPVAGSAGAAAPPRDNPLYGVLLMLSATFLFAAMHVAIRHIAAGLHPFEVAFFRTLFGLIFVIPWFVRFGLQPLHTRHFRLHALRGVFNAIAMLAFFYALILIPLAEVTALGFTAPIFATLLAGIVLGEALRLRRWVAIGISCLGVLLVLRPGFQAIGLGQLLVLLSSLAWACALLGIKTLSRTDSSVTIITYMSLLQIPLSLVPALFVWQWPDYHQLLWLVAIGVIGGGGQWLMTEALRQADAGVVMPIDFCKLPWTALLAYLVFSEVPDVFTLIGGAVIFAATAYLALRESAASAPTVPPPAAR